jgi:hypothetical protein
MKMVRQACRSVLLLAWTAAGVGPAWAQDAAAPAGETSRGEVCDRLVQQLEDAWSAGASVLADPSRTGDEDTVVRFTSLFEDYIEKCPCSYDAGFRTGAKISVWEWRLGLPSHMWDRHKAAYERLCERNSAAPAEDAPPARDPMEDACLRGELRAAWYSSSPPPAQFTSLFDDYIERCPCDLLEDDHLRRHRIGRHYLRSAALALLEWQHSLPSDMWARHEEAYARRCQKRSLRPLVIGAGVVVAGAGTLAVTSGGGNGGGATGPGTPPTTAPPPVFEPAGTWSCNLRFVNGDVGHVVFVSLREPLLLSVNRQQTTLTVTGQPGDNFVPVVGPFANRQASLTGAGVVAGRPGVGVRFEMRFPQDNTAEGTYTVGTGGELPGGTATTYGGPCARQ